MADVLACYDPKSDGYAPRYHTGKPCIEDGCDRPAGTAWSPYWCMECNMERIRRIDSGLAKLRGASAARQEPEGGGERS